MACGQLAQWEGTMGLLLRCEPGGDAFSSLGLPFSCLGKRCGPPGKQWTLEVSRFLLEAMNLGGFQVPPSLRVVLCTYTWSELLAQTRAQLQGGPGWQHRCHSLAPCPWPSVTIFHGPWTGPQGPQLAIPGSQQPWVHCTAFSPAVLRSDPVHAGTGRQPAPRGNNRLITQVCITLCALESHPVYWGLWAKEKAPVPGEWQVAIRPSWVGRFLETTVLLGAATWSVYLISDLVSL